MVTRQIKGDLVNTTMTHKSIEEDSEPIKEVIDVHTWTIEKLEDMFKKKDCLPGPDESLKEG